MPAGATHRPGSGGDAWQAPGALARPGRIASAVRLRPFDPPAVANQAWLKLTPAQLALLIEGITGGRP